VSPPASSTPTCCCGEPLGTVHPMPCVSRVTIVADFLSPGRVATRNVSFPSITVTSPDPPPTCQFFRISMLSPHEGARVWHSPGPGRSRRPESGSRPDRSSRDPAPRVTPHHQLSRHRHGTRVPIPRNSNRKPAFADPRHQSQRDAATGNLPIRRVAGILRETDHNCSDKVMSRIPPGSHRIESRSGRPTS
jgi:hypothetical protein